MDNLSFEEYIKLAECTAAVDINNHLYYVVGLIGEVQEYIEDSSIEELGDVYWYFGQLLRSLSQVSPLFTNLTQIDDGPGFSPPQDLVKKAIDIGQLCNKLARSQEFGSYVFSEEKVKELETALKNFGKSLKTEVRCLATTQAEVFKLNLVKLYDRFEKLTGIDYYAMNGVSKGLEEEFIDFDNLLS